MDGESIRLLIADYASMHCKLAKVPHFEASRLYPHTTDCLHILQDSGAAMHGPLCPSLQLCRGAVLLLSRQKGCLLQAWRTTVSPKMKGLQKACCAVTGQRQQLPSRRSVQQDQARRIPVRCHARRKQGKGAGCHSRGPGPSQWHGAHKAGPFRARWRCGHCSIASSCARGSRPRGAHVIPPWLASHALWGMHGQWQSCLALIKHCPAGHPTGRGV